MIHTKKSYNTTHPFAWEYVNTYMYIENWKLECSQDSF